ncbi:unnamed protein product [Camellia sinensis]
MSPQSPETKAMALQKNYNRNAQFVYKLGGTRTGIGSGTRTGIGSGIGTYGVLSNKKKNTKEMHGSTSDIISNLPESIKATILVCLPIQDATGKVVVASDTLSSIISSCPLLEKLSLKRSFSSDCLEINAPNLRFLVYEICGTSICLKHAARLARVSICFMGIINVEGITHAETSKLVTLFGSLPVIEFLLLEYRTIRDVISGVPKRLPTTLNNLKTLKLFICFEEVNEISVILCLIRSSPNLEKITIMVRRSETADVIDHVLQLLEMQDWSDVSLNQLQVVELSNLSGTQSELKFIELLLAISAVLETINREGC